MAQIKLFEEQDTLSGLAHVIGSGAAHRACSDNDHVVVCHTTLPMGHVGAQTRYARCMSPILPIEMYNEEGLLRPLTQG